MTEQLTPRLFWTTRGFNNWHARNNPNLPGTAKFRKWQRVAEAEQTRRMQLVSLFVVGFVVGLSVGAIATAAWGIAFGGAL